MEERTKKESVFSRQSLSCPANSLLLSRHFTQIFFLFHGNSHPPPMYLSSSHFLMSLPWRSLHFKLSERYPTELCCELSSSCLLCRPWLASRLELVVEQFLGLSSLSLGGNGCFLGACSLISSPERWERGREGSLCIFVWLLDAISWCTPGAYLSRLGCFLNLK